MIGLCTVAFLWQLAAQQQDVSLVERLGMIPARVLDPAEPIAIEQELPMQTPRGIELVRVRREAQPSMVPPVLTLVTCIFLHGGWMHFLGNMWFLHIFGDNVEDRLGHVGYTLFYLAAGVAASATHLISAPNSMIPTIGASGAIAGVMGAYMCMYPHAKVVSIIPIFIIIQMVVLPAPLFLGIWFLLQFFQGVASVTNTEAAGVAWWAHIGGFVAGMVVAKALDLCHLVKPPVEQRRGYR
jgi:membrane associated rhomboid family serine protease